VKIYEDVGQLEVSRSGDITMILPLYPIEEEVDETAALTLKDLSVLSKEEKEILRSFKGRVERVDKGVAYMTMIDNQSRQSYAECPLDELRTNGISNPYEGMMFTCNIERKAKETSIYFKPLVRRKLTDDEIRQIDAELEGDFPDTDSEDDY